MYITATFKQLKSLKLAFKSQQLFQLSFKSHLFMSLVRTTNLGYY